MIQWWHSHTWVSFGRTRITPPRCFTGVTACSTVHTQPIWKYCYWNQTLLKPWYIFGAGIMSPMSCCIKAKNINPFSCKIREIWALKWEGVYGLKAAEIKSPWRCLVDCVTSADPEFESQTEQRALVEVDEGTEISKWKQAVPVLGNWGFLKSYRYDC